MSRVYLRRAILAALIAVLLAADQAAPAASAAAQVTPANALVGLFRVLNAVNRRNRTYQAAQDTQKDFDAYYAALRDTARAQFASGELEGLKFGAEGPEKTRLAAYLRLNAALEAERAAVQQAINAETNAARRRFNQDLGRTARDVFLQLPGAQQTLGQVRTLLSNVRTTVTSIRAASASQPLDPLTNSLAQQVSSASAVQNAVRNLGSMAGAEADRALGGALSQAQALTTDVTKDTDKTLELLNQLDAELSRFTFNQAEYTAGQLGRTPLDPHLVERATAAVDVAAQALAVLTAMQSSGGMTHEQLYAQIRAELLEQRNAGLLNVAMTVSAVECKEVYLGEYETVAGFLGEAVPADTENAKFYVCYDKATGEPLSAWVGRVDMAMPEAAAEELQAEPITGQSEDSPPEEAEPPSDRLTLEQVDAGQYLSFTAQLDDSFSHPTLEAACYATVTMTNTHPTRRLIEACEHYDLIRSAGPLSAHLGGVAPGEVFEFSAGWHTYKGELRTEYYPVRCVAYLGLDEEGLVQPGTQWIRDTYPEALDLLNSGLTVVVAPNPCAR